MRTHSWLICLALVACGPSAGPSPDAGEVDAGSIDAGPFDAGAVDAGTTDAGTGDTDAGALDAGAMDAGTMDAGAGDDAGTADAGSSCGSQPARVGLVSTPTASTDTTCGYASAALDLPYVMAPPVVYRDAGNCGACVELTGTSGVLLGRVVDLNDQLDGGHVAVLDPDFRTLADAGPGFSTATWRLVACPTSAPMQYRFASSFDPFVRFFPLGNRWPLAVVEARRAGNTAWTRLTRGTLLGTWSGTLPSSLGSAALELRLTDVLGHVVIEQVTSISDGVRPGTQQFPPTCK
ncbi:MAG: hypothetical protein ACOZQL_40315 [Myxococcota bacterium]